MFSKVIVGVLLAVSCGAQAKQEFEVASIKLSPPPEPGRFFFGPPRGGPGTGDPTRFSCTACTLTALLNSAYDLKSYQLKAPDNINENRFDIAAKVPEGATKEQFREMLRNMLADRFKVVVHRETKEMQVYDLTVGKGAPKMKESADQSDPPPAGAPAATTATGGPNAAPPPPPPPGPQNFTFRPGKDGFPELPPGRTSMIMMPGRAKLQAFGETMASLANRLSQSMAKPVTDSTGLTKKYDFTLTFAPDGGGIGGPGGLRAAGGGGGGLTVAVSGPPPGAGGGGDGAPPLDDVVFPLLPAAVQEQLGLKLEAKKGSVEIVVVDKFEKTPTEN